MKTNETKTANKNEREDGKMNYLQTKETTVRKEIIKAWRANDMDYACGLIGGCLNREQRDHVDSRVLDSGLEQTAELYLSIAEDIFGKDRFSKKIYVEVR